jgi:RimJ/RimL family protein N-acetyltransferase
MALHVDALFRLDEQGRMLGNNTLAFEAAPRFYLGRCEEGAAALVRHDVAPAIAADLLELASSEPPHMPPRTPPRHADRYIELLEEDGPIGRVYFGPAMALPGGTWLPPGEARRLALEDVPALRPHFPWLEADIEAGEPAFGAFRDGVVVAQCSCARLTDEAAEAGVEVAEAYRGQGLAKAAVAAWAQHMRAAGRVVMYSTWWENEASLAVAAALGFEAYATDWHAT